MGQVSVTLNGRTYRLECGEGEETHLIALAEYLGSHVDTMKRKFGQIGDDQLCGVLCGTPQDVSSLSSGVTMIAGCARHVCAETASTLYCWGDNFEGQLGDNGACGTFCLVPVVVAGAADFPVGDANCDHATNSIDSAVILQFGAGLINHFPVA
jgi:alpha-tubulin suppressor-like RCC1 family protein